MVPHHRLTKDPDLKLVNELIESGADVNTVTPEGTPLLKLLTEEICRSLKNYYKVEQMLINLTTTQII